MESLIRTILAFCVLAVMVMLVAACPSNVQGNRADSPAARARQQQQGDQSGSQSPSGAAEEKKSSEDNWLEDT